MDFYKYITKLDIFSSSMRFSSRVVKKEGLEILDENTVDHNFQAEDLCRANRVAMAVNPIPVKTKDRQSLPS